MAGGELEIAFANQIQAARIFALGKKRGLCGQTDGAGDQLKVGQNRTSKGAEPARTAVGTGSTPRGRLTDDGLWPSLRYCRDFKLCHLSCHNQSAEVQERRM